MKPLVLYPAVSGYRAWFWDGLVAESRFI